MEQFALAKVWGRENPPISQPFLVSFDVWHTGSRSVLQDATPLGLVSGHSFDSCQAISSEHYHRNPRDRKFNTTNYFIPVLLLCQILAPRLRERAASEEMLRW